jgi:ribonucleotide reductase beta subunit family protein with ferritin-like domain
VGQDKAHFNEIETENPWIKTLIWNVIGFFVPSDGLIIENVESNFAEEVAIPEYRAFLAVQANNELVHSEMYSRLAQCYVEDIADRNQLFHSIETMPAVRRKVQWAQFWLSHKISFAERLVAYTAVEGILFAASFSIIFWIRDRFPGKLPGLTKSNEWISRDENIHVEAGTALYHHLPHKLPLERIKEIYLSALEVELYFLRSIMPEKGINGLTLASLEEHVRYMTNFWFELYQDTNGPFECLVLNPDGSVPQPLPEVRRLSRFVKANFFEVRNGNYINPNLSNQFVDLSVAF